MDVFRRIIGGFGVSPYPLGYTLRYLYYAKKPSFRNHTLMNVGPLKEIPQRIESCYQLLFFGDLISTFSFLEFGPRIRQLFRNCDLAIGNLEGPLIYRDLQDKVAGRKGDAAWAHSHAEEFILALLQQIELAPNRLVFGVANNHAQDFGDAGLVSTVQNLKGLGVECAGHFLSEEQDPIRAIVLDDKTKIGLVAWTEWLNRPVDNRFSNPEKLGVLGPNHLAGIDWSNEGYDYLVAFPHWDFEYQHFPCQETRRQAAELAQNGFSIIAGAHPHVVQPVERIGSTLCLYSMGNFSHPGHSISNSVSSRCGVVWQVFIDRDARKPKEEKTIGYQIHPIVHDRKQNYIETWDDENAEIERVFRAVYRME